MLKSALGIAAALSLSACVVAPVPPPRYAPPPVAVAPPPPRVEVIGVAPAQGYVWMGGYWRWGGGGYYWVPGYWGPPRPAYRW